MSIGVVRSVASYELFGGIVGTQAPNEFVLFPSGNIQTTNGPDVVLMDSVSAASCIAAFKRLGRDIPIDYEHTTEGGRYSTPDGVAPAAGWIKDLRWDEARGLIARVQWTERARKYLDSREYRYHSPVFYYDRNGDRRIQEVESVALTNNPATINALPLVAKRIAQRGVFKMENILRLLGLDESATIDDIAGKITDTNVDDVAAFLGTEATREAVLTGLREKLLDEKPSDTPKPPTDESGGEEGGGEEGQPGGGFEPSKRIQKFAKAHNIKCGTVDEFLAETGKALLKQKDTKMSIDALQTELVKAKQDITELRDINTRQEFDKVCATLHKGKVPPADSDKFYGIFKASREQFDAVMKAIPAIADGKSVLKSDKPDQHAADSTADKWNAKIKEIADRDKIKRFHAYAVAKREAPELYAEFVESGGVK
jgi:hypothetical protein